MIYLDWAATSKPNETLILEAVNESLDYFANPSSYHIEGKKAKKRLEEARANIANLLSAKTEELYFCSSATEGVQIVFSSLLNQHFKNEIIISDNAHSATKEMAKSMQNLGYKIIVIPTNKDGFISSNTLLKSITEKTALISLILVDNETGAIESISQIQNELNKQNFPFALPHLHLDCVQALCKIPIDFTSIKVDSAVLSAHKIGAMRGGGILYLKKPLIPFLRGGGQENGLRAGTENLCAILSLEKCLKHLLPSIEERREKAQLLTNFLMQELGNISGVEVFPACRLIKNAKEDNRFSPYIVAFYTHYIKGEVLVRMLSDEGIAISSGSACSSNSKEKRIINGLPPQYRGNIARVSIGEETTKKDIEVFIQKLKQIMGDISWK